MKYRLNEENYIEDFASENDTNVFEMEKELSYFILPNCAYAYQVVDGKLIETPYDFLQNEKASLQQIIKPLCQEQLTNLDWKVLKYQEQQLLIENNIEVNNPITKEQYLQTLQDKQTYRDLSNYAELAVNDIKNEQELKDAKDLFSLDFSDITIIRNLTEDFKRIYGN